MLENKNTNYQHNQTMWMDIQEPCYLRNKKTVELYLDSQQYTEEEIIKSIEQSVNEFSKKDVRVNVDINEWGVYVIRLDYIDKDTYLNKLKYRRKQNRKKKILKKYSEQIKNNIYEPSNQIISVPIFNEKNKIHKVKEG